MMLALFARVLRFAGAAAIAVAFCCVLPAFAPAKDFSDTDVKQAVDRVITERSKDGVFVFHDPRLDADLNLVFEDVKIIRGMEGYGWFANVIFHDKDEPKKQYAIDFWFKPRRRQAHPHGHQGAEGTEAGGRWLDHGDSFAGGLVVAPRPGASGRHRGHPRLAGDGGDPQLHRHA
jgi:hypothetical protein